MPPARDEDKSKEAGGAGHPARRAPPRAVAAPALRDCLAHPVEIDARPQSMPEPAALKGGPVLGISPALAALAAELGLDHYFFFHDTVLGFVTNQARRVCRGSAVDSVAAFLRAAAERVSAADKEAIRDYARNGQAAARACEAAAVRALDHLAFERLGDQAAVVTVPAAADQLDRAAGGIEGRIRDQVEKRVRGRIGDALLPWNHGDNVIVYAAWPHELLISGRVRVVGTAVLDRGELHNSIACDFAYTEAVNVTVDGLAAPPTFVCNIRPLPERGSVGGTRRDPWTGEVIEDTPIGD